MFVEFAKMYMPGSWADGLVATGTTRFRIFAEGEAVFTLTRRTIGAVIDRSVHGAYVACKKASDKLAEMARSDADQAKAKQAEAERAKAKHAEAERAEAEQAKAKQAEAAYAELKTAYDVLRTERDELRAERIACKAVLTQLQQTMQLLAAGTQ
jgi:predicted phage tail protein